MLRGYLPFEVQYTTFHCVRTAINIAAKGHAIYSGIMDTPAFGVANL
jgi:hypothetical protein